jgi:hypothetical protein
VTRFLDANRFPLRLKTLYAAGDGAATLTISRQIPPHFVHRIVQYSEPARPGMMRTTLRRASHCGQLVRTMAGGLVPVSGMGGFPQRFDINASLVEIVDAGLGVRHRRIGIGPGETDFERRKRNAIDDDRLSVRPPDPGVPQAFSSLESLNRKAVIIHGVTPD